MTKIDKIEQVLLAGKKVTPLTAIQICGAMRLAALIFDLKKRGHKIITTIMQDTQGNDYAEYRLMVGPTAPEVKPLVVGGTAEVLDSGWGHAFPVGAEVKLVGERESTPSDYQMFPDGGFDCSCPGFDYTQVIPSVHLRAL